MSPFTIIVIMILALLFIVLSVVPLISGQSDFDSSHRATKPGAKTSH